MLLTHEHIDHVKSVSVLNKKMPGMFNYSNIETYFCVADKIPDGRRDHGRGISKAVGVNS